MLYTASMKPIMSFLEDSGPGVHDTTAAACSHGLYVLQIGEARPATCMHWVAGLAGAGGAPISKASQQGMLKGLVQLPHRSGISVLR